MEYKNRPKPLKTSELMKDSNLKFLHAPNKNLNVLGTAENQMMPKGEYVPDDLTFMPFMTRQIPVKVESQPVNHYYVEMTRGKYAHKALKDNSSYPLPRQALDIEFTNLMRHIDRDLTNRPRKPYFPSFSNIRRDINWQNKNIAITRIISEQKLRLHDLSPKLVIDEPERRMKLFGGESFNSSPNKKRRVIFEQHMAGGKTKLKSKAARHKFATPRNNGKMWGDDEDEDLDVLLDDKLARMRHGKSNSLAQ